jgi:hypothetical protein
MPQRTVAIAKLILSLIYDLSIALAEGYRLPEKSEYELNVWMPFVLDAPGIEKPDNNRWLPQLECFPSPVWAGGSGEEGARK